MAETEFRELASLCELLAKTSRRNEKIRLISEFLRRLGPDEVKPAVHLIIGSIFPTAESKTLNVGWATMSKVGKDQSKLFTKPLTIMKVAQYFDGIASSKGRDSKAKKAELLTAMLSEATEIEGKWISKNIQGEMQHGVSEGVMVDAIAKAAEASPDLVRVADMLSGNLGEVATTALLHGGEGLSMYGIQIFKPVKPMLAEITGSVEEALHEHGGRSAFEIKLDGARIQMHKKGPEVRVFSRHLSEVTESLPDVVSTVRDGVRADVAILEGEAVAVGKNGKPMVFQDLMRRFGRIHDIHKAMREIPLQIHLFDILYLEGEALLNTPYEGRRKILEGLCDIGLLVKRLITADPIEAKRFLESAMMSGHEGLMAKELGSVYEVGKRGKRWLKVKPSEELDLVIVAADWGYGRRTGWLSNYHLAARDEETGEFLTVGKTFKGLTDVEFTEMTTRLQGIKVSEDGYTVRVKPLIVVQIAFNEIQKSPHYRSGLALRFARITRLRDDKSPDEADTIQRVRALYEEQFRFKARVEG